MKITKVLVPVLAITAMTAAAALGIGCHAEAQVSTAPPPPPPPPPAPPAPPVATATVAPPAPPAPPKKVALKGVQMKSATQIDMPGDVEYQSGSAKILLNDKSKKVLTTIVTLLKDNPELTKLRIEGHTDNAGENKGFDNVKLSQERAQSVADWLGKNGVDAGRLVVKGFGSQHPLAANDTPDHMALNRRTEFHVQEYAGAAVEVDASGATSTVAPTPPTPAGAPAPGAAAKTPPAKK